MQPDLLLGLGPFNVVASWVMACEYLSLGLHVGNYSRPTPLTIIFFIFVINRLVGWAAELGPGAYPDFLSYFFPTAFFRQVFSGPRLTTVLLVVAQLSLFS